jgi:chromosome segregation ATPase
MQREEQLQASLTEQQREAADHNETRQAFTQLQADLASAERALSQERSAFESQRLEFETQLNASAREVGRLEEQLTAAQQRLDDVRTALTQREEQLQASLTEQQREAARHAETLDALAKLQRDLASAEIALDEARKEGEVQRQQFNARLAEQGIAAAELASTSDEVARLQRQLTDARQVLDQERLDSRERENRLQTQLAEDQRQAAEHAETRQALAQLQADFDAAQQLLAGLQADLADSQHVAGEERAAFKASIDDQQSRLEERVAEIARQQQAIERSQADVAQLTAALAELNGLGCELDSVRRTLEAERAAWQTERQELTARASQQEQHRVQELTQLARQISELESELETTRRRLDDERGRATENEGSSTSEGEAAPSEAEAAPSEAEAADQLLARFGEPASEVTFEAPTPGAPVSTSDLLSQFGLSTEEAEEVGREETDAPARDSSAAGEDGSWGAPEPSQAASELEGAGEDHEESIDSYMSQLMARLGNSSYTGGREESRTVAGAKTPSPQRTVEEQPEAAPLRKLRDTSEIVRRAPAPERSSDLSALREIANLNARTALDAHSRSGLSHRWLSRALFTFAALASALVCGWFGLDGNAVAVYLAVVSLGAACYCGASCLSIGRVFLASRRTAAAEAGRGSDARAEADAGNDRLC